MGKAGSYAYADNAQISVAADLPIIVGQQVSQPANDKQAIEPALQALQETAGRLPDQVSADNGYWSGANLPAFEDHGVDAYSATDRGEKAPKTPLDTTERQLVKTDFDYDAADNVLICPQGHRLVMVSETKAGNRVYQGREEVGAACPLHRRCCQSAQGHARTLTTDSHESLRQAMRQKMANPGSPAVYKQRKVIVEPVFGHIKNSGFRGFSVRGLDKVAGEFSLVGAAHNFKKMAKAIIAGLIRPAFGNYATNPAI